MPEADPMPRITVPPFRFDERAAPPDLPRAAYRPWPEVEGAVTDRSGTTWRATSEGLRAESEERVRSVAAEAYPVGGAEARDVAIDDAGTVWIATERGITLHNGHDGWRTLRGCDGLPCEDVRRILLRANGERWFATARGVVRLANGRWSLFAGKRWLPGDDVVGLAEADADTIAVLCQGGGTSAITSRTTTLRAKALRIETEVIPRHTRMGYVADCSLASPGDPSTVILEATDNDGLWTSLYLAAECFRYAVTSEPEAADNARAGFEALLRLEEITGIPGFPARAAVRKDEANVVRSEGEWHESPCGNWLWKGDTSSDELNGHYFAYALYHDLVADDADRVDLRGVVDRITSHLLEHDFSLVDADGRARTRAVFSPRSLNYSERWVLERGLNSLSALAFLKVACALCGRERYTTAYEFLVRRHRYAINAIDQKITLPGEVNHSDDELAFLAYYPLLRYEADPSLLCLYRLSLERTMRSEAAERNPLWNVIASVGLGRSVGLDDTARTLMGMPVDRVAWDIDSTARDDLGSRSRGRFSEDESDRVLPYSENGMLKWNGNPYALRCGGGGRSEDDGAAYLLPYWMARYHGLLSEE